MNENIYEKPKSREIFTGDPLNDKDIEYLNSRYHEARAGGEKEYLDLLLNTDPGKRFKIGPYFVAIVDNDEIHHYKGINVNISRGWDARGITLILLSSALSSKELEFVLCHEMEEDLNWAKGIRSDNDNFDLQKVHLGVEQNPKTREQILAELDEFQKTLTKGE